MKFNLCIVGTDMMGSKGKKSHRETKKYTTGYQNLQIKKSCEHQHQLYKLHKDSCEGNKNPWGFLQRLEHTPPTAHSLPTQSPAVRPLLPVDGREASDSGGPGQVLLVGNVQR